MFWIHSATLCDVPVLEVHGELDAGSAGEAWQVLTSHIACGGAIGFPGHPGVILNLSKLEFLDSAGLAVLVRARKRCDSLGGWLILSSPQGEVALFLERMHMDEEFLIWDDILEPSRG